MTQPSSPPFRFSSPVLPLNHRPPDHPRPPDIGNVAIPIPSAPWAGKVPFRDKMMNGKAPIPRPPVMNLIDNHLAKLEYVDGNRMLPKFSVSDMVKDQLAKVWEDTYIITVVGKKVGFLTLRDRLTKIWKLNGGFEMIDVGHGFFLVKFEREEDRDKVTEGGPWMVFDHYLAIVPWSRNFHPKNTKVTHTLVWVRFPDLNVMYYDESILRMIGSAIGTPIKVDMRTSNVDRGKFARVCVQIDLSLPVVGRFCLDDQWYHIEYEGLHLICSGCGRYGHHGRNCDAKPDTNQALEQVVNTSIEGSTVVNVEKEKEIVITDIEGSQAHIMETATPNLEGAEMPIMGEWVMVKKNHRREIRKKVVAVTEGLPKKGQGGPRDGQMDGMGRPKRFKRLRPQNKADPVSTNAGQDTHIGNTQKAGPNDGKASNKPRQSNDSPDSTGVHLRNTFSVLDNDTWEPMQTAEKSTENNMDFTLGGSNTPHEAPGYMEDTALMVEDHTIGLALPGESSRDSGLSGTSRPHD